MQRKIQLAAGRDVVVDDHRWGASVTDLIADRVPLPRLAFAAAHVPMRAAYLDARDPNDHDVILEHVDWPSVDRVRRRLDDLGFGVAEAMDTAQRFDVGWTVAERLIRRCGDLELRCGFVAGAAADHRQQIANRADLIDAVVEQGKFIQSYGGWVVILPLPWLVQNQVDAAGYVEVYREIAGQLDAPAFVHWLGPAFHPDMHGYFPGSSFDDVMAAVPETIRGCKLSLLDADFERSVRRRLRTRGQVVLTGDDFDFGELIRGDGDDAKDHVDGPSKTTIGDRTVPLGDFSHALLGILDGVAAPMSLALRRLGHDDRAGYDEIARACETVGRHVFMAPTRHYKAGLAFLAWLDGLQDDFVLAISEQRSRDREHYLRLVELAASAGAFTNALIVAERLDRFLLDGVP